MKRNQIVTLAILCYINLINYMDRYVIAGILPQIKAQFNLTADETGMLQTAFVVTYMICAPVFGYMGDRYNRNLIMAMGIAVWGLTTLMGSFMEEYLWFLILRGFVGVGEASYSTVAPTIISDMFEPHVRLQAIAAFYFAIPVGSGIGYIIGSQAARISGSWRYGLRVTPVLGAVGVILILFWSTNPKRGLSESKAPLQATSWTTDLQKLAANPSYMLSTAGFTCVTFVTGALGWWGPYYIHLGKRIQSGGEDVDNLNIAAHFGLITLVTGLLGVALGTYLGQTFREKYPRSEPLICGYGLIASVPLIFFSLISASFDTNLCLLLIFVGQLCLNLYWSILADILFQVVIPIRRSSAEAFQILFGHLFGDAGSPYLIGVMAEIFEGSLSAESTAPKVPSNSTAAEESHKSSLDVQYLSMQYALYSTALLLALGALCFFLNSIFIVEDRNKANEELEERYRLSNPRGSEEGNDEPN